MANVDNILIGQATETEAFGICKHLRFNYSFAHIIWLHDKQSIVVAPIIDSILLRLALGLAHMAYVILIYI